LNKKRFIKSLPSCKYVNPLHRSHLKSKNNALRCFSLNTVQIVFTLYFFLIVTTIELFVTFLYIENDILSRNKLKQNFQLSYWQWIQSHSAATCSKGCNVHWNALTFKQICLPLKIYTMTLALWTVPQLSIMIIYNSTWSISNQ